MQLPGAPSLLFLVVLFVLLPAAAIRGSRRLAAARAASAGAPPPPRQGVWIGTLLTQAGLLWLAWLTGRSFGYPFLAATGLGSRQLLAAGLALLACFALRAVLRASRSEEERRDLNVYLLAPRSPREWQLWTATVLVASVAEETAYRGVGMSILWYALGNAWLAALLCSVAFALAHWLQGWKSVLGIFVLALVMHGLVEFTETLAFAILVHAIYDLVAGVQIAQEARAASSLR